jgi:hypothetical protein
MEILTGGLKIYSGEKNLNKKEDLLKKSVIYLSKLTFIIKNSFFIIIIAIKRKINA